jgi:hypothetical protein
MGLTEPRRDLSYIKFSMFGLSSVKNTTLIRAYLLQINGDKEMREAHNHIWEFPHTSSDSDENKSENRETKSSK